MPVGVDDEDAVGGRVERRVQERERGAELGLDRDPLGDVVGRHHVAADGGVVEQVDDRELERDVGRRGRARARRRSWSTTVPLAAAAQRLADAVLVLVDDEVAQRRAEHVLLVDAR